MIWVSWIESNFKLVPWVVVKIVWFYHRNMTPCNVSACCFKADAKICFASFYYVIFNYFIIYYEILLHFYLLRAFSICCNWCNFARKSRQMQRANTQGHEIKFHPILFIAQQVQDEARKKKLPVDSRTFSNFLEFPTTTKLLSDMFGIFGIFRRLLRWGNEVLVSGKVKQTFVNGPWKISSQYFFSLTQKWASIRTAFVFKTKW